MQNNLKKTINDIFKQNKGQKTETLRQMLRLCQSDHSFLLAVTSPFLKGILTHALHKYTQLEIPPQLIKDTRKNTAINKKQTMQKPISVLSNQDLSSVLGQIQSGQTGQISNPSKHSKTIKTLVAAFKKPIK